MSQPFSSEIVQLPAVQMRNGTVSVMSHEMRKLTSQQLRDIAKVMGGKVIFVKVRATYEEEKDTPLCTYYNCYRPVKDVNITCADHV